MPGVFVCVAGVARAAVAPSSASGATARRTGPARLPKVEPERIALAIAADGTLTWNGQPMPDVALGPQLRIEAAKSPPSVVVIDAHDAARYERVASVLATARNAGIRGVGFDDSL